MPKKTTNKLQHVRNSAAGIVSNTRKYDRGLRQQHELHWLDVVDCVRFRVCVQVYKCLHTMARGYLSALCQPVSSVPGRHHQLVVVNWTSPVSIYPRTGDGRLPTPVLHLGTRCLTISGTSIFLFKLSNVILRHSSFPHTSTFNTFEVSYKNALYKFTVIIIICGRVSVTLAEDLA